VLIGMGLSAACPAPSGGSDWSRLSRQGSPPCREAGEWGCNMAGFGRGLRANVTAFGASVFSGTSGSSCGSSLLLLAKTSCRLADSSPGEAIPLSSGGLSFLFGRALPSKTVLSPDSSPP